MEEVMKVIVFDVKVPEDKIMNGNCDSNEFTMDLDGKTSLWKLGCYLNFKNESTVGFYSMYISGDFPSIKARIELVNHDEFENNFVEKAEFPSVEVGQGKGVGNPKIISHDELFKRSENFFPDGHMRFVTKVIIGENSKPLVPFQFTEHFKSLHETMKLSDVIFKTSDDKEIPAHKLILSTRSPVFEAMFSNHESTENKENVINSQDIHSDVIKEMLRFIYCEAYFDKWDLDETEIYHAAEKYQIDKLKKICMRAINEKLTTKTALKYLFFAEKFNLKDLYSCCLLIIFANFSSILKSDDWKNLESKSREKVLEEFVAKTPKMKKGTWISSEFS